MFMRWNSHTGGAKWIFRQKLSRNFNDITFRVSCALHFSFRVPPYSSHPWNRIHPVPIRICYTLSRLSLKPGGIMLQWRREISFEFSNRCKKELSLLDWEGCCHWGVHSFFFLFWIKSYASQKKMVQWNKNSIFLNNSHPHIFCIYQAAESSHNSTAFQELGRMQMCSMWNISWQNAATFLQF